MALPRSAPRRDRQEGGALEPRQPLAVSRSPQLRRSVPLLPPSAVGCGVDCAQRRRDRVNGDGGNAGVPSTAATRAPTRRTAHARQNSVLTRTATRRGRFAATTPAQCAPPRRRIVKGADESSWRRRNQPRIVPDRFARHRVYPLRTAMAVNNEVLALILGGGQGSRLFPLTHHRSKPAVPIGGKYRLIDIPISNCLHADIRRIFVLTQFNSASLNRHISQAYRMDLFSQGFVEILAAEQTPDNPHWYQGTADAVRQAARHFVRYDADYYLILAGDHLYRMNYTEMVDAHIDRRADITIAAQPVSID